MPIQNNINNSAHLAENVVSVNELFNSKQFYYSGLLNDIEKNNSTT